MTEPRRKSVATEVKVLITTLAVAATVGGWAAMSQANANDAQAAALAQTQTDVVSTTSNQTTSNFSAVNSTVNLSSSTAAPAPITFTRSSR